MAQHRHLYRTFWNNAVLVMRRTLEAGGIVVIEGPASCQCLRLRDVRSFIKHNNLQSVRIDGCAFGMQSSSGVPAL